MYRKDKLANELSKQLIKQEKVELIIALFLAIIFTGILLGSKQTTISRTPINLAKTTEVVFHLPDFAQIQNTKQKKQAFIEYLRPIVRMENLKNKEKKALLEKLRNDLSNSGSHRQSALEKLKRLAKSYRVNATDISRILQELETKIDEIPESLVIAQAANESGWGTSRFAKEANNLFGQWCYSKNCGIIPSGRSQGAKHQVRVFKDPVESVASYMKNINSHPAYEELRSLRKALKQKGSVVSGIALAQGLTNYSERRQEYVDEITTLIRQNSLE
ncbi:glucosaminidase domain-containing protein [Aliikangiella sp. G2MR2-5]|uniref:glucosaminidase domain-containing protein n=1 Tax=Aliikangiella sp. G2MR2-5 TaxID=2788943 RepID=UPI0018A9327A|nr:glucosaminidase domain-containing protein [Aliikangiella sp. G2MR2-5]